MNNTIEDLLRDGQESDSEHTAPAPPKAQAKADGASARDDAPPKSSWKKSGSSSSLAKGGARPAAGGGWKKKSGGDEPTGKSGRVRQHAVWPRRRR